MKRLIRIFVFAFALIVLLTVCVQATEVSSDNLQTDEKFSFGDYVRDKIVPVAVGVGTSLLGLLATLVSIFKALKELKKAKQDAAENDKAREENSKRQIEELTRQVEELKKNIEEVITYSKSLGEIKKEIDFECEELGIIGEILVLGFSSNSDIVKTGKGKQINLLLDKLKGDAQNEKA